MDQSSRLAFDGAQTLQGAGTIAFVGNSASVTPQSGILTVGPNITIQAETAGGTIGNTSTTGTAVINQGVISAAAPGKVLTIAGIGAALTNNGILEARNGGTLLVSSATTNLAGNQLTGGAWRAYANSALRLVGADIRTNAAEILLDGANARILNAASGSASALVNLTTNAPDGQLIICNGANFTSAGALANAGIITVGVASTLTVPGGLTNAPTGILGGTGTISGAVVVNGTLAPGNSIGTLTLNGGLTLASGAKLDFELGSTTASDLISMSSSTLTLNNQQFSDFRFTSLDGFGMGMYTLIDAGSISGSLGTNTAGMINGLPATLSVSGGDVMLTVVPEPSTFALLGMGALGLLGWAWTRARSQRVVGSAVITLLAVTVGVAQADVFNMARGLKSLELVAVGDPGNAADSTGYGAVGHTYNIGKYDVTAAQYTQFLNAVARTDPYGLYNSAMFSDWAACGIYRYGSSGSYTYETTRKGDFPVNSVTWGSAARFCNWLHNRQPTGPEGEGTTETGAYALNGAVSTSALIAVVRSPQANFFIPSEDEWYKAAYYKGGSASAGYWAYPTRSDSAPSNLLSAAGTNNANFHDVYSIKPFSDASNYLTCVGAFAASPGPYGTYDMGGDVNQWNEAQVGTSARGYRGASWSNPTSSMISSFRASLSPVYNSAVLGFRVASVPEPSSLLLLVAGGIGLLGYAWRRQKAA